MGYKRVLGALKSPKDVRNYKVKVCAAFDFPETFELDAPPVRNQMDQPTCVAHAFSSIVEYFYRLQHPDLASTDTKMSIIYVYANREAGDWLGDGMSTISAAKAITRDGETLYVNLPGNMKYVDARVEFDKHFKDLRPEAYLHRFTGYAECNGINEIKQSLMFHGPVAFGIDWYTDLKYKDGVLDSETRAISTGGHCMFIYGWNEKGWLIQNSWGPCWGNKGRAILPFDFPLWDARVLMDEYVEGTVPVDIVVPWFNKTKLGKIIAKILNWIINLFKEKSK